MEVLKSRTVLNHISAFCKEDFAIELPYLWIWNPEGIPPHMGLSVDGRYFSLKANGLDFNSNLLDLLELISRKKLPVLAVELKLPLKSKDCELEFAKFEKTVPHKITCLNPIKNVLSFPGATKLSELLMKLDDEELLGTIISWNIGKETIELAEYSTEDIHNHLVSLSK
ncbi:MAG: hypothetical protein AB8B56_10105 [Crocinitomicaceae bacterium]